MKSELTLPGYFKAEIEKHSIPVRPQYDFPNLLAAPSASEIDELADRSQTLEQRVASLNDSYETLRKREVELTEWRWVLTEAGGFFDRVVYTQSSQITLVEANEPCRRTVVLMRSGNRLTMTKHLY